MIYFGESRFILPLCARNELRSHFAKLTRTESDGLQPKYILQCETFSRLPVFVGALAQLA